MAYQQSGIHAGSLHAGIGINILNHVWLLAQCTKATGMIDVTALIEFNKAIRPVIDIHYGEVHDCTWILKVTRCGAPDLGGGCEGNKSGEGCDVI